MKYLPPRLRGYLKAWFTTSTANQTARGKFVTLTFEQFIGLFKRHQLKSLERAIIRNELDARQNETNQYAYVLTWRSYAHCSSGIFSKATACICTRKESAVINLPQQGDRLRPEHRTAISAASTGVPKSVEHRSKISAGKKGRSIAGWSEERKAERRAANAAKRAAQATT